MIDINSIKTKEVKETLKYYDESKGIFVIAFEESTQSKDIEDDLNNIFMKMDTIKEIYINSNNKVGNLNFDQMASKQIEILAFNNLIVNKDVFSNFLEQQKKLKELNLSQCKIENLSFLDNANENLKKVSIFTSDMGEKSVKNILKYRIEKFDYFNFLVMGEIEDEFIKIYENLNLSNHFKFYMENVNPGNRLYKVIENCMGADQTMTVNDYLKLDEYINFKNLNDGIKRKIFIDEEQEITEEYLEKIKQICTDENFSLVLEPEQVKKIGDKIDKDVYVKVEFEDIDELEELKDCPECVKEIEVCKLGEEVSKEQLESLMQSDVFLKYNKAPINLKIKSAAELSVEELDDLTKKVEINSISMDDVNLQKHLQGQPYSIEEYRACRMIIDELLDGIDMGQVDDSNKEKKIFGQVIKRLANHMSYDYSAIGKKEKERNVISRNMIGGLIDGKCVCAGYAEIVRNVFACAGIEARYIAGYEKKYIGKGAFEVNGKKYGDGHAWNQIKLDGTWYNMDLTWDRDSIKTNFLPIFMLKSDKEFAHNLFDTQVLKNTVEECPETVKWQVLNRYIYGYDNLAEHIVGIAQTTFSDMKNKIKSLWDNFSIGETDIREAYRTLAKTKENNKNINQNNEIDEK